jgi:hypothetical protein
VRSTTVQTALEANLAAIAHSNNDIAQRIRNASPASGLTFTETPQDVPAGVLDGRHLCSRHRPRDEANQLTESVDLVRNAVVAVLGFGMGYHVQALAQRMGKAGIIVVYEPDVSIIRSVLERVDHSSWINACNLVWVADASDRGALAQKLTGVESVLAQGMTFVTHPASRDRLGERAAEFSRMFSDMMNSAKTSLLTTLVRASDTVRNLVLNLDHYVSGEGMAPLKDCAAGYPAVVVSAGPSLRKNMHLLAQPGVRDRCVIIAVQTVLKPLLHAGIKPHFVTALDYHEISRRFYDGLTAEDVRGVTLVADPKVHPVVVDSFPGVVRCCQSRLLDHLLGELSRDMGQLPSGSTVAHLAMYVADYLGCNPIALIGQDLGFTDGLYYGPGTAIDDVWAPELGPFNTIEMMQWQRIVRHRQHLHKRLDVHGRTIYADSQMTTYLQQFERDFHAYAARDVQIIDATEGGIGKQHVKMSPLCEVLERHATRELPDALMASTADLTRQDAAERTNAAGQRVRSMRRQVSELHELARRTQRLIDRMLADQADAKKMQQHFAKLKQFRKRVADRQEAFSLLEFLNQLGSFNRNKADRELHMRRDLDAMQRQQLELQRDRNNVVWISDAANVMAGHLQSAEKLLAGEPVPTVRTPISLQMESRQHNTTTRVAALIPVDLHRNGCGLLRSLAMQVNGRSLLQATLERLCASTTLERIILIASSDADIERLLDRRALTLPIEIEPCHGQSPFGSQQRAIAAARAFSQSSWRGGIGGMSVYDELLCPDDMFRIMEQRGLTAGVLVGPDWPLVDVSSETGIDAIVERHCTQPERHRLVLTPSPPGLGACLVSATLMKRLATGSRLATIGAQLVYQPHNPQPDPVGLDTTVQVDHRVGHSLIRAAADEPSVCDAITHLLANSTSSALTIEQLETWLREHPRRLPAHVIMELTTARSSSGLFSKRLHAVAGNHQRGEIDPALAKRVFDELGTLPGSVVTFAGVGDPLLHQAFDQLVQQAKQAGVHAVHVRTELRCDRDGLESLLVNGVDVISVDLHADSPATYQRMMGDDRFGEVLKNIEYLINHRKRLSDHSPVEALAVPWIMPRLQRCDATYADLESFYDRWQHVLGAAIIEGGPGGSIEGDSIEPAVMPAKVVQRELSRRMLVLSDGTVPVSECDDDAGMAGNIAEQSLESLWQHLRSMRNTSSKPVRVCFA